MKDYIAIVKNSNNKVTNYLDFNSQSEADSHVVKHGGFVVSKPDGDLSHWVVDADAKTVTLDTDARDAYLIEVASRVHKLKRIEAYGNIGDQLDMQYKDLLNDTTTWKDFVAKVKSDNPKPE